jgi:hypothetical protein
MEHCYSNIWLICYHVTFLAILALFGEQDTCVVRILLLLAVLLCYIIFNYRHVDRGVSEYLYSLALYKIQSNICLPFSAGTALYFFLALRLSK